MDGFEGKVAVITGAASGIGLGMAQAFAEAGIRVVLSDVEIEALDAAAAALRASGADVHTVVADVSDAEQVQALAHASLQRYGGIDILCNNAGVGAGTMPSWHSTLDDWQWVLGVNLMGVVHGVRSFVPRMRARGMAAHIVNTSSAAGLATIGGSSVYCASKHAVVAFSECLAKDLAQVGAPIGVSVLCPSLVATRIDQSQRNRPAALPAAGPTAAAYGERVRAGMAASDISAEDVARAAVDAIHARRFYIIPHAHTGASVRDRSQKIMGDFHHIHQESLQ